MFSESNTLSIVIPCYNESRNIERIYEEIKNIMEEEPEINWEIVFVDDGSTDDTFNQMLNIADRDGRVKIVKLARNFGKEIAVLAGVDSADGENLIIMDADLQHPPGLIREFIRLHRETGYDIIQGVKRSRGNKSLKDSISAKLFYVLFNKLSEVKIQENSSDYIFLSSKAKSVFKNLREKNRFNRGLFSWMGLSRGYIYFDADIRTHGKSKFNLLKLVKLALNSITSFSVLPLRISMVFGFIVSAMAFSYGIFVIFQKLFYGIEVEGYASIMVAILFLGGLQMIFLGIIGEYIGKIYTEIKNRPLYIIEDVIKKRDIPDN